LSESKSVTYMYHITSKIYATNRLIKILEIINYNEQSNYFLLHIWQILSALLTLLVINNLLRLFGNSPVGNKKAPDGAGEVMEFEDYLKTKNKN